MEKNKNSELSGRKELLDDELDKVAGGASFPCPCPKCGGDMFDFGNGYICESCGYRP